MRISDPGVDTWQTLGADMADCVDINARNVREVLELAVVEAAASASG